VKIECTQIIFENCYQAAKVFESIAEKVQALLEKACDDVTSRVRRLEVSSDGDDVDASGLCRS